MGLTHWQILRPRKSAPLRDKASITLTGKRCANMFSGHRQQSSNKCKSLKPCPLTGSTAGSNVFRGTQ
eukprot:4813189-Heterocapsa_arctica.AAC.1